MTEEPLVEPPRSYGEPYPLKEIPLHALTFDEKARVREAANRARLVYSDAVGRLIHRELMAYQEFGFRFEPPGFSLQVVDEVFATPLPEMAE